MKTKKVCMLLVALCVTASGFAQVLVNTEGNTCFGLKDFFFGFRPNQVPIIHWSDAMSNTVNVGGGVSIAATEDTYTLFSLTVPIKTQAMVSVGAFFYASRDFSVYSRNGIIQSSDSTLKSNIAPLTSTLNKIKALKGVSFNFKNEETANENPSARSMMSGETHQKHIGLLAQDVEKVYPEAVRTLRDGTKGVLYADLIAVLIEGVKELNDSLSTVTQNQKMLQQQVDRLLIQMEAMQSDNNLQSRGVSAPGNNSGIMQEAALYQNTPNPTSKTTEISYRLTSDVQNASIGIYDLNGKQLKQYRLNVSSISGKIEITATDFEPGMYIYALVVDGKMIDSKRMLIENPN